MGEYLAEVFLLDETTGAAKAQPSSIGVLRVPDRSKSSAMGATASHGMTAGP